MGKVLNVVAAAAILGAATTAFAAEPTHKATGKIKSVDVMRHVITLEDGSTYKVARGVNIKRDEGRREGHRDHLQIRRDRRGLCDHAGG